MRGRRPGARGAGAAAVAAGLLLLALARPDAPRPRLADGAAVVTTTQVAVSVAPPGTPPPAAPPIPPPPAPVTAPPPTVPPEMAATPTTRAVAAARPRCPAGRVIIARVTWDASGVDGDWRVHVDGTVENATSAPVELGAVALTVVDGNGARHEVAAERRPVPQPTRVGPQEQASFGYDGPAAGAPSVARVEAALTSWRWSSPPSGCPSAG